MYIQELGKQHFDFHPEFMDPENFLKNRINYLTECTRQACYSNKKIVIVSQYKYVDKILESWKKLDKKITPLRDFYPRVRTGIDEEGEKIFAKTFEDEYFSKTNVFSSDSMTYIDYIEKLVIIDFFYENFIYDNFVQYNSFPYSGKHTLAWMSGFTNLFHIWKTLTKNYKEKIDNYAINNLEYVKYINTFNFIEDYKSESEEEEENVKKTPEEMEKESKEFDEQLKNPASNEILKELKGKAAKVEVIQNKNPFKHLKKKQ